MIAFGVSVTEPKVYERCAEPGIRLVAEPDTEVMAHGSTGSVFRSYNMLMDQARKLDGLEALVLIHQDAEIIDPDFLKKIREALSDPDVAIVGCAGAIGVRNIAWWDGSVTWASFTHRYEELGGGEVPALAWTPEETPDLRARPARSRPSTASCSGSRPGRSASCASTSPSARPSTATTSTSACRRARRARRW